MKVTTLVSALIGAAGVAAHGSVMTVTAAGMATGTAAMYTTYVSTAYVTYCPKPTAFMFNNKSYTVTKATTLTITDCPEHKCKWVAPVMTSTSVYCPNGQACVATSAGNYSAPAFTGPVPTGPVPSSVGGGGGLPVVAGATRITGLSGAALAGVLAVAVAM